MKKIIFTSHMLYLFFRGLCWIIPFTTVYLILFHLNNIIHLGMWATVISPAKIQNASQFSLTHRMIVLMIEAIPVSVTVLICNQLAKLFHLFEQERLFEEENIRLIKHISLLMILGQILQIIYQPLLTAALTFTNPSGQRFASITLGTANASMLITAFIILIASWIIKEASQLKSEVQFTV